MDLINVRLLLLLVTFSLFASAGARTAKRHHSPRITVVGAVYCDTCSSNAFTKHSFFLPGVDVQIRCKFRANSARSSEQVNYSVNRTTDRHGIYKLEIPGVDGVNCVNGLAMASMCQSTLLGSKAPFCAVPSLKMTSEEISIKSEQDNLCIYSLNSLSFKPHKKNATLCRNKRAFNASSSKCFFPFPWPDLPGFSFPPLTWPFPFPFPFPDLRPPTPGQPFNLWDPRTWTPSVPPSPPGASRERDP